MTHTRIAWSIPRQFACVLWQQQLTHPLQPCLLQQEEAPPQLRRREVKTMPAVLLLGRLVILSAASARRRCRRELILNEPMDG